MSWSSLSRAAAALLSLALVACGSTTAAGGPSQANPLDPEESAAVAKVNSIRMAANVPLLTPCTSLNVSASAHSDEMRDNGYLSDVSPVTMSTVRTRACAAGYMPACSGSLPMAELVAEGSGTGPDTVMQWQMDATAGPILTQADLLVVGIGRSIGVDNERWTMDFASQTDPSCN